MNKKYYLQQFYFFVVAAALALRAFLTSPLGFGRTRKQKGKKEGGWGEEIFALLRLRLERFRFPLIKKKPKQKFFISY